MLNFDYFSPQMKFINVGELISRTIWPTNTEMNKLYNVLFTCKFNSLLPLYNYQNCCQHKTISMPQKLTEDSNAVKLMKSWLKTGDVTPNMTTNVIWAGHSTFQEYKLVMF